MGLGILATIKSFAPSLIYFAGIILFFTALSGRVRWTLAFVVFLIPLRNIVERLHGFPGGTKFLTILIFVMILAWILMTMGKKITFMENSALNGISILMIFYLSISLQIGNQYLGTSVLNVGDSRVQDWKNLCMMPLLYFITANTIVDRKWVWRIFAVMCFSMFLMAYYTSTQITWFSSLVSRNKITGTFQFLGVNEVAAFFNQYTLLLMSVYFAMKKGREKLIVLVIILANLYCILFLFSRAAYLGAVVGMFVLFAIKNKKLLIPLIFVVLCWQAVLPGKAIERIQQTTDEYGQLEESASRRLSIWAIAMEHFEKNPVTGIGFGVFRHLGYDLGDTHNIYLKILVEQGILGFIIFLILCGCFAKEGWVLFQRGDDDLSKGLGLGLFVCTLVMMVNNFFGDRFTYFELGSYMWIYAGLVTRLNVLSVGTRQQNLKPKSRAKKSRSRDV